MKIERAQESTSEGRSSIFILISEGYSSLLDTLSSFKKGGAAVICPCCNRQKLLRAEGKWYCPACFRVYHQPPVYGVGRSRMTPVDFCK